MPVSYSFGTVQFFYEIQREFENQGGTMLNRQQIKEYRQLRGLTTRDVAAYCEISQPLIVQVENGTKDVTKYNHDEILKGINAAFAAKKMGTYVKPSNVNLPKTATETGETTKPVKKSTKKKSKEQC